MTRLVLSALAFWMIACSPTPDPVVPTPTPVPDPYVDPVVACADAGKRLGPKAQGGLECRDVSGAALWQTPNGTPFADACVRAWNDGRDWHPECIATAKDCKEASMSYDGTLCNPKE